MFTRFLIVFLSVFVLQTSLSANGKITGKIVDSETGDEMIGANVFFEDTMIGAASDLDGIYTISKVPPGQYNLVISMIGYAKKVITGVQINTDEVTKLDVSIEPEILESDEVVVSAKMIRNTESALLKDRQKAISVSDAISAEAISKSGSGDAAEAMTKVTGASVVDGKYVYIRGLGDRYSSTTLNGTEIPSADPDKRAVQMDMFPSNLLENIVTTKSFTPDKPGSFSGGSVNVGTKSFPESFTMKFSTSSSYNSQANLNSNYLQYSGSGTDWLGYDNGLRELPEILQGGEVTIPTLTSARRDAELAQQLDQITKAFKPVMAPTSDKSPINQSYGFSVGNQIDILGRKLGFLGSLSYKRGYSFYDDGATGRYELTGQVSEIDELNPLTELRDIQGKDEVMIGGLGTLSYKIHKNHEIGFNTFFSQSGESTSRYLSGSWPQQLSGANSVFETRVLKYSERNLQSYQLSGTNYFSELAKMKIEWKGAITKNSQDEPDTRFFSNHYTPRTVGGVDTVLYSISSSIYSEPSRYFRYLEEDGKNADLDIEFPFEQWAGYNSKFKVGASYLKKDRTFEEFRFQYERPNTIRYLGDPVSFFADENIGVISADTANNRYEFANVIVSAPDPRGGNYSGDSEVFGTYFMLEMPLLQKLKFVGGLRYEITKMEVSSADTTRADSLRFGRLDDKDFLPSINLVYTLTDNMNLRTAYGRTLARPTLREKAPYVSYEFANDYSFAGNVNLKRTLIDNFDLRWEWFPRPGEIYAISGFYKHFQDPIERSIVLESSSDNPEITYDNVDVGKVFGLELEFRKGLDQIAEVLKNFNLGANLSLVHSAVDIPEDKLVSIEAADPEGVELANDSRPLQGQSPYLLNVDFGYNNYDRGTAANFSYNLFGDRLSEVTTDATPDVYERARAALNFTFSQRIYQGLGFKFAARNILDSSVKFTHEYKGQEFIRTKYKRGRSFSFGFGYEF